MKAKSIGKLASWCVSAFLAGNALAGETHVWTGAEDAYWTNAANWQVGGAVASVPPGLYRVPADGFSATNGSFAGVAEFGAVAEGKATTINLDGLWDVSNITVKAGAPAYTFGSAASQVLTIHSTGGVFKVESGAAAPTVAAKFGCVRYKRAIGDDIGSWRKTAQVCNMGTAPIVLEQFGYQENVVGVKNETPIVFSGTGDIKITGVLSRVYPYYIFLFQTEGGKWILDCPEGGKKMFRKIANMAGYSNTIHLTENGVLEGYHAYGLFESVAGTVTVEGEGAINCVASKKSDSLSPGGGRYIATPSAVSTDGRLIIKSNVTSETYTYADGSTYTAGWHTYKGSGTTEFKGTGKEMGGFVQALSTGTEYPKVAVESFGTEGANSSIGTAHVMLANSCRCIYTGVGETTDRSLYITNHYLGIGNSKDLIVPAIAEFEQAGTGTLTLDAGVVCEGCASATLVLINNGTQDAICAKPLTDGGDGTVLSVTKRGTGVWTFAAANTYTGATKVEAGTLVLKGAAPSLAQSSGLTLAAGTSVRVDEGSASLPAVSVAANGTVTISVADGATLAAKGVTLGTSTLLNIETAGSGSVTFEKGTALPDGVKINGKTAECDANGKVIVRSYAVDVAIAAHGGVIPASTDGNVGITTVGEASAGNITLAAAAAAANVLVQKTAEDATVELTAGQTLTAGTVAINEGAAGLTVGSADGQGTLASTGDLLLDNPSDAALTVRANVSVPTGKKVTVDNGGLARITSPFDWAGTIQILNNSTLALSNDTQAAFSSALTGVGTLRKEGADSWTLGTSQSSGFAGTLAIAGGKVSLAKVEDLGQAGSEIQVTNNANLTLTSSYGSSTPPDRALVLQGTGPDGKGALTLNGTQATFLAKKVTLTGDTTIRQTTGSLYFYDYTTFDMNGHALTWAPDGSSGTVSYQSSAKILHPGAFCTTPWYDTKNSWHAIYIYCSGASIGTEDDPPFCATNGTRICMGSPSALIRRRVVAAIDKSQTAGPEVSFSGGIPSTPSGINTNESNWAGPVEIVNEGTSLYFHPWGSGNANRYVTISGQISGKGGLNMGYGSKSGIKGHVILANANNTFEGPVKVNGSNMSSLEAMYPGSIPDWAKLTFANYGYIAACWGYGRWTKEDFVKCSNQIAPNLNCYVYGNGANAVNAFQGSLAINTSYCENQQASIAFTDADINAAKFSVGHDGRGTLEVRGPFAKPVNFSCYDGTLRFTGDDRITLGCGFVTGDCGVSTGTVEFVDAKDVHFTNHNVTVGMYAKNMFGSVPKMKVRNSTLVRDFSAADESYKTSMYDALTVGLYGAGILEIGEGSVMTGRVIVGMFSGIGSVRQTGGTVVEPADENSPEYRCTCVGWDGHGSYELSGGTHQTLGLQMFGSNGRGIGCYYQTGGQARVDTWKASSSKTWRLANGVDSRASFYLAGGTFALADGIDPYFNGNAGAEAVLTVAGGEYLSNRPANPGRSNKGTQMILNFNGGVFAAWDVAKAYADTETEKCRAYANFNGGTLRGMYSSSEYGLFGCPDSTKNWNWPLDRVTVFAGGATIEIPEGKLASVDVPLTKPSGKGIVDPNWTGKAADYVALPYIEVEGDGTGASLQAVRDAETGDVRAIVTSPGNDYTWATAYVLEGTATNATLTLNLAEQATTGGFTKKGAGQLTLNAANTYGGDTTVLGGTLKLGIAGAIPTGSKVHLKGGKITAADGVTLPALPLVLTVGETAECDEMTFPAGSTLTIENLASLDHTAAKKHVLATYSGLTALPAWTNANEVPEAGWRLVKKGNDIRLAYPEATVVILR